MRESVPQPGFVLAALAALAVACGGETRTTITSAAPETQAATTCSATLADMNGAPCQAEGLSCLVNFQCPALPEEVRCTCEDSRFHCYDPVGPLLAGESPRCTSTNPEGGPAPCPPTMVLAQGLSCAEVGRSCYYDGEVCPDGTTKLDYCQCKADGAGGFTFVCGVVPCAPDDDAGP
jgi:hypothetical protein